MSLYGFFNRKSWGYQNCWGNKVSPQIWMSEVDGPETSQHLFDPYSLDHVTWGCLQYIVIPINGVLLTKHGFWIYFLINVAVAVTWELCENSACAIYYFRSSKVDPQYVGDSVVNSISDVFCMSFGWWISIVLFTYTHWYYYLIFVVCVQALATYFGVGIIPTFYRVFKGICACQPKEKNTLHSQDDKNNNNNANDKSDNNNTSTDAQV